MAFQSGKSSRRQRAGLSDYQSYGAGSCRQYPEDCGEISEDETGEQCKSIYHAAAVL